MKCAEILSKFVRQITAYAFVSMMAFVVVFPAFAATSAPATYGSDLLSWLEDVMLERKALWDSGAPGAFDLDISSFVCPYVTRNSMSAVAEEFPDKLKVRTNFPGRPPGTIGWSLSKSIGLFRVQNLIIVFEGGTNCIAIYGHFS